MVMGRVSDNKNNNEYHPNMSTTLLFLLSDTRPITIPNIRINHHTIGMVQTTNRLQ